MIVDTDVLIWYLRGNDKAFDLIESLDSFYISVITYMELVQGMRNKKELNRFRQALRGWNVTVLYLSEEISIQAMFAVEQHFLSHSLLLADALIGATALHHGLPLLTANDKHYRIMKGIELRRFRT